VRFLLLIYDDESGSEDATPELFAAMLAEYEAYDRAVQEAGVFVSGEGLQPTATARTVRMRDGAPLRTGGPFKDRKKGGNRRVPSSFVRTASHSKLRNSRALLVSGNLTSAATNSEENCGSPEALRKR